MARRATATATVHPTDAEQAPREHRPPTGQNAVKEVTPRAEEQTPNTVKAAFTLLKVTARLAVYAREGFAKKQKWSVPLEQIDGTPRKVINLDLPAPPFVAEAPDPAVAARQAFENEELTCSRTGEKVARKDAVVVGVKAVAITALKPEERAVLGLDG